MSPIPSTHLKHVLSLQLIPASVLIVMASHTCFAQRAVMPEPANAGIGRRSLPHTVDVDAESLGVAAANVMASFHVPGGIILMKDCSAPQARSFTLPRGTTLKEALDVLVREFGGRVTVRSGFIDIWSNADTPPLLRTRIQSLEWRRSSAAGSVFGRIRDLPELSLRARELGLESAPLQGGATAIRMGTPYLEPAETGELLRLENTTFLDALNSLAVSKGSMVWEYVESVCESSRTWTVDLPVH